jgi:carbonic anhydrase
MLNRLKFHKAGKDNKFFILACCVVTLLLSACKTDDDNEDDINCSVYEWTYEGDSDPDTWHVCNADCGGSTQSPVNISGATADATLTALELNYQPAPINVEYNGHTVEFTYAAGSTLTLGGVEYELEQFHFHTLSEHTLNGQHYPMEIHLVHQSDAGAKAVVSILVTEGAENPFLANFSDNYPTEENAPYVTSDMVNVAELLPADAAYYSYSGSLTTPPCSEMVSWFVMKTPVEASAAQINNMAAILNGNYRPTQDLNGRVIKEFM